MSGTRRQKIALRLAQGPATVRELAAEFGVQIKIIVEDLEHVRRSLRETTLVPKDNSRLPARRLFVVEPARCLSCGFVFKKRERLTAPSRCPECRSENTDEPVLVIE